MSRTRTVAALTGVLGLALTGVGLTAGASSAAPAEVAESIAPSSASTIDFGPCASERLADAGAQCGVVPVPLDHSRPGGAKIKIAVSRVRHTVPDAKYQGVVLVNPGGPGGSGLGLSVLGQYVPKGAGAAYDWIGFDPRGVGSSSPSLECVPNYFGSDRPDYVPTTKALEQVWRDRSARYASACGRDGGALLEHMKTTDAAKDMDAIREALGQRRINYYGFSYGTYLGQVYATLFPDRLRRAVFDSNVDPRKVWYQANLDQDVAFDRNIGIFFGWVARHDDTYHLGRTQRDVEQLYYAEQDRLRRYPAGGVVGPDEWVDAFLQAGYYEQTWVGTAEVFASWVNDHKSGPLIEAYRSADGVGESDNGFAVYNAVQCTDVQWPQQFATWRQDNWAVHRDAPFETWANAWFNAPCLTWPAKAGTPVAVDGKGVAPVLLVGETLDAATPYAGSLEVRRRFPASRLIGLPGGTSHANSLYGNACVDDTIADYLLTGALPARKAGGGADKTCQPAPQPEPSASVAAVTGRQELGKLIARVH